MTRSIERKKRYRRWRGMAQAARDLGVSYGHLRQVLLGVRDSKKLTERYRALKAQDAAESGREREGST